MNTDSFPIYLEPNKKFKSDFLIEQLLWMKDKEGYAEDFFFLVLKEHIKDVIFNDRGVKIHDKYLLRPDFIIFRKSTGILLAIEIDEPYVLYSDLPIHYRRNKEDQFKNKSLIQKGFHVLRLAENQVSDTHIQCLELIESILSGSSKLELLPSCEIWTEEDVKEYIKRDMRFKIAQHIDKMRELYSFNFVKYLTKDELKKIPYEQLIRIAGNRMQEERNKNQTFFDNVMTVYIKEKYPIDRTKYNLFQALYPDQKLFHLELFSRYVPELENFIKILTSEEIIRKLALPTNQFKDILFEYLNSKGIEINSNTFYNLES